MIIVQRWNLTMPLCAGITVFGLASAADLTRVMRYAESWLLLIVAEACTGRSRGRAKVVIDMLLVKKLERGSGNER
ncbi:hypothetical protein Tco_1378429 [Tanacetum coccineum]